MGAFDSECAALGIGRNYFSHPSPPGGKLEKPTFYVCWNGQHGGATGKHFDTKDEAMFFAQGMAGPLMGTECWFDTGGVK